MHVCVAVQLGEVESNVRRGALAAPEGTLNVPLTVGAAGCEDANVVTPASCQPFTTYLANALLPFMNFGGADEVIR